MKNPTFAVLQRLEKMMNPFEPITTYQNEWGAGLVPVSGTASAAAKHRSVAPDQMVHVVRGIKTIQGLAKACVQHLSGALRCSGIGRRCSKVFLGTWWEEGNYASSFHVPSCNLT